MCHLLECMKKIASKQIFDEKQYRITKKFKNLMKEVIKTLALKPNSRYRNFQKERLGKIF